MKENEEQNNEKDAVIVAVQAEVTADRRGVIEVVRHVGVTQEADQDRFP